MLAEDICAVLSAAGVGTAGVNLFAGFLPDAPDAASVVYETGGSAPTMAMRATVGAVVENPSVQVVSRALAYDEAAARATSHTAWKALCGLPDQTVNGTRYLWALPIQSPFLMGRDEAGRVLIAFNADVVKEVSA